MPRATHDTRRVSVLLIGSFRQTLTVARSLHRAGYRVIVGHSSPRHFVDVSRAADEVWRYPPLDVERPEPFQEGLTRLLRARPDIRVVFPIDQYQIEYVARHGLDLPPGVALAMANQEAVETCLSKSLILSPLQRMTTGRRSHAFQPPSTLMVAPVM